MKKLYILFFMMFICNNTPTFSMKRLPEETIEQGHEKKVKIQPTLIYPLSNGQFIELNKDAVLLCDQLINLLDYSQEDYNLLFPGIDVNQIPYKLDLTDDEVILLFNILNTITQSARSFTDQKSQKCYYLNQDVFEITFNICKERNALTTDILIKMIGACDFLICNTLLNTFTKIFVDKSKELTVNHTYNFADFPENSASFFRKHLKRKTLGIKLNTYIPECNIIDYIILTNGLLPIINNQIILNGLPIAKLTSLDGLEMVAHNINASFIVAIHLGDNYLTLTSNFISLQNFPNVSVLNLSNNQFIQLPENIFNKLDQLQALYLNHNQLIQLSKNIFNNLVQLNELGLDNNSLVELPENIFNSLTALTDLYLNNNQLTQLSKNIFNNLHQLQLLYLDHNKLITLPENIFNNLHLLQLLHLDHNKLTTLPENIFNNLAQLQELSLDNNPFVSLPEKIVQLLYWLNPELNPEED